MSSTARKNQIQTAQELLQELTWQKTYQRIEFYGDGVLCTRSDRFYIDLLLQ